VLCGCAQLEDQAPQLLERLAANKEALGDLTITETLSVWRLELRVLLQACHKADVTLVWACAAALFAHGSAKELAQVPPQRLSLADFIRLRVFEITSKASQRERALVAELDQTKCGLARSPPLVSSLSASLCPPAATAQGAPGCERGCVPAKNARSRACSPGGLYRPHCSQPTSCMLCALKRA